MNKVYARKALLPDGWADNVAIEIAAGRIVAVQREGTLRYDGLPVVLPGVVNAHSHAFQRALAGHTEYRGGDGVDTFWTWRKLMYALAGSIDADALFAIASQLYAQMLTVGYTTVVEFHYLHRAARESEVSGAMRDALLRAADAVGIRIVYAPVLYERSDFGSAQPTAEQRQFAMSAEAYFDHYQASAERLTERSHVALAAHSLRAVTPDSLTALDERSVADGVPLHIHVAEQEREVEACLDVYGARPVQWLLARMDVDDRWTLVHATHMDVAECEALAASGAVAALCPSTEGNLGDGMFPLQHYLESGGSLSIGSDSHVSIDPFEELRWLEYGQRLSERRRNVAAARTGHTGSDLFTAVCAGGAQSAGLPLGLQVGAPADLIVIDDSHPALIGHGDATRLDALVFAADRTCVERVMVAGEWCVTEGRHREAQPVCRAYADAVRRLDLRGAAGA